MSDQPDLSWLVPEVIAQRSKVACNYVPCCQSDCDTSNIRVAVKLVKSFGG